MRILVHLTAEALPGRDGERLDTLARSVAALIEAGHEIAVTTAGPAEDAVATGSRLVRALTDVLPGRSVAALLTHAEVRAHDPALLQPASHVDGSADDAGPITTLRPYAVLEAPAVRDLLACSTLPVCAAGPAVIREPGTGRLRTVQRTANPERTAVVLAEYLDTDLLLFLTGATHLFAPRSHGHPRPLLRVTPQELADVRMPEGARVVADAAAAYVTRTEAMAAVGPADNALGIVRETTGTLVRRARTARPA